MAASRKWICVFLLLAFVGIADGATSTIDSLFNRLTVQEFAEFKKSPLVRAVYFYKQDVPTLQKFLSDFKVASEILNDYGVRTATINCQDQNVKEFCERRHPIEKSVIIFKYGSVMTEIGLDAMYCVDAMMSNILQMVLLGEVPIVQTKEELETMMQLSKGGKDILFSYQKAVGTYEHRIFLEVAFVYSQRYKFAFTTTPEIVSAISQTEVRTAAIWYLQCKVATSNQPCPILRYTGPMNLATYSRYMKLISVPNVIDLAPGEMTTQFQDLKMHQTFIFTDTPSYKTTKEIISEISQEFIGLIGFSIVNIEKMDQKMLHSLGFNSQEKTVPSLAFLPSESDEFNFMRIKFTETNVKNFLNDVLESLIEIDEESDRQADEGEFDDDDFGNDIFDVPPEEIQDDPIEEDAFRIRHKKFDTSSIPALTDKTFPTILEEKDLVLIMFYVPWNPVTQVFMQSYNTVGKILSEQNADQKSPLARVDCSDWPDVCEKNNVTKYPTFLLYKDHKSTDEYVGRLETQTMLKYMMLHASSNPVTLTTKEEAELFMNKQLPANLPETVETLVLGLFADDANKEKEAFTSAGAILQGKFLLGSIVGSIAKEISPKFDTGVSSIVVIKFNDKHSAHAVLQQDLTTDNIVDFIQEASLPVYTELTPQNFMEYQSLQKPFLILFGITDDIQGETSKALAEIAKSGQLRNIIFCYMNIESEESLGGFILQTYMSEASLPALILVNHDEGKLYNYPHPYDMSKAGITEWLHKIGQGNKITPTGELIDGKWKPMMAGYDFLSFIDSDQKDDEKIPEDNGNIVNETPQGGRFIRPVAKTESQGRRPVHTEL